MFNIIYIDTFTYRDMKNNILSMEYRSGGNADVQCSLPVNNWDAHF